MRRAQLLVKVITCMSIQMFVQRAQMTTSFGLYMFGIWKRAMRSRLLYSLRARVWITRLKTLKNLPYCMHRRRIINEHECGHFKSLEALRRQAPYHEQQ